MSKYSTFSKYYMSHSYSISFYFDINISAYPEPIFPSTAICKKNHYLKKLINQLLTVNFLFDDEIIFSTRDSIIPILIYK